MKELFKQVSLFLIVAVCLTLLLIHIGAPLVVSILFSVIIQYIAYNAYIYGLDAFAVYKLKKLEVEKLRELSYQGVEVVCPCSQQAREFVPIRLNRPNYYKCNKCSKTVGVFTAVETALVTEPIADTDISSIEKILQNKLNEFAR